MTPAADLNELARRVIDDNREAELRLYVARIASCEVHVPGRHPVHGRGLDSRQPADPTAG